MNNDRVNIDSFSNMEKNKTSAIEYKECRLSIRSCFITRHFSQKIYHASDDSHYLVVDIDRKPSAEDNILLNYQGANCLAIYKTNPFRIKLTDDITIMQYGIDPSSIIGVISRRIE